MNDDSPSERRLHHRLPEVLAPAGDRYALLAALASGADAVYFGLDEGFNARARARNFTLDSLDETVALIHRAGARAYLTVNTLVFEPELAVVERILGRVARSGVDALIVQDPAVALLARAICPTLELHASTQMTVSSAEGARFAAGLGCTRMVVPRELSVDEIRRLAETAPPAMELEVFVHGALCVSWSGQCLSSEAWGGRSANRGQCAQACRLPYDLVVDGTRRDLGEVRYLLSPQDQTAVAELPELAALGVHGLKIEGRQKGPQYVATATAGYRAWIDAIGDGERPEPTRALRDMALSYSRGLGGGFFDGADHQRLVDGRFPKHRGIFVGEVLRVDGTSVVVTAAPAAPELALRAGMGVVFDGGHPEEDEPGGPLFSVAARGRELVLGFGKPGPDLRRVAPGQRVWATSDPALGRATERLLDEKASLGRIPLALAVAGRAGEPLVVTARARGHVATARSRSPLAPSSGAGLGVAQLVDKLGALGGTPFHLDERSGLDCAALDGGLHLPVSELKALRRELVTALVEQIERGPVREVRDASALDELRRARVTLDEPERDRPARLVPLCRNEAQLDAVLALHAARPGVLDEVELDWMELVGLGRAVAKARAAGIGVTLATVRVQKPGEEGYDARLAKLAPDALLVRHWGALMHFAEATRSDGAPRPRLHGDFSLNVTNSLTARHLLALGLDTVTAAHDLDQAQLLALVAEVPASRLTVVVHHHVPTFHTEHCVYAHLLSDGRDWRSCGRPCEQHEVALADHVGLVHPVIVDVGCRNTVFNAQAQSAASLAPSLRARGVRRFRVEFVRETLAEAARVIDAYQALLDGTLAPSELVRRVGVHEQFGVTRGTMRVLQ